MKDAGEVTGAMVAVVDLRKRVSFVHNAPYMNTNAPAPAQDALLRGLNILRFHYTHLSPFQASQE